MVLPARQRLQRGDRFSYVPPTDITQEFKVQTTTYDSQFATLKAVSMSIAIKSAPTNSTGPLTTGLNQAVGQQTIFEIGASGAPVQDSLNQSVGSASVVPSRFLTSTAARTRHSSCFLMKAFATRVRGLTRRTFGYQLRRWRAETFRPTYPGQDLDPADWHQRDYRSGDQSNRTAFTNNIIPANRISPVASSSPFLGAAKGGPANGF